MEITDVESVAVRSKHRGAQQVRVQDDVRAHFVHIRWTVEGDMPYAQHVFDYVLVGILGALKVGEEVPVRTPAIGLEGIMDPRPDDVVHEWIPASLGVPPAIRERINRVLVYGGAASDSSWLHGTDQGRDASKLFTEDCRVIGQWLEETS